MATHSSILAWEMPWTEEPGGLVHGLQTVGHDQVTKPPQQTVTWCHSHKLKKKKIEDDSFPIIQNQENVMKTSIT